MRDLLREKKKGGLGRGGGERGVVEAMDQRSWDDHPKGDEPHH